LGGFGGGGGGCGGGGGGGVLRRRGILQRVVGTQREGHSPAQTGANIENRSEKPTTPYYRERKRAPTHKLVPKGNEKERHFIRVENQLRRMRIYGRGESRNTLEGLDSKNGAHLMKNRMADPEEIKRESGDWGDRDYERRQTRDRAKSHLPQGLVKATLRRT